jgi:glycerol uptake facilitator-like aquaporin
MGEIAERESESLLAGVTGEALALGAFAALWIALVAATEWTSILHQTVPVTLQALILAGGTAFLMLMFRDWSGGHLNPLMTFVHGLAGRQGWRMSVAISAAHIVGAFVGLALVYAFATAKPVFPLTEARVIAEFLGAAVVINAVVALRNEAAVDAALGTGAAVALIYWISGGATLVNPALTLAQGVFGLGLDTLQAGPIIASQFLGAFTGYYLARLIWP